MRLAGPYLPGIEYWRGVREALSLKGIDVVTAVVPPSGSIEERAKELEKYIAVGAHGKDVNIIAYVILVLPFSFVPYAEGNWILDLTWLQS